MINETHGSIIHIIPFIKQMHLGLMHFMQAEWDSHGSNDFCKLISGPS